MLKFKSTMSLKNMSLRRKKGDDGKESPSVAAAGAAAAATLNRHCSSVSLPATNCSNTTTPAATASPEKRLLRTPPTSLDLDSKRRRKVSPREATTCSGARTNKSAAVEKLGRHVVVEVRRHLTETHLTLRAWSDNSGGGSDTRQCFLRGSWAAAKVTAGDVVNVLADFDVDVDAFRVDDSGGLLVVNPDLLVSGTSVVSTLFCMRKAVLNETFKGLEGSSKTMFTGTLVHELLQECLRNLASTSQAVNSQLELILAKKAILQELLTLNISVREMRQEVEPFLPHILYFTERYVLGKNVSPPVPAFTTASQGRAPPPPQTWQGKVDAVEDIEENIWSPRLGIKGKIDLTVKVNVRFPDKQGRLVKTMPLELKTGRASGSAEHRGQVILYSMMMSERREDPGAGLLLYLRNSSLQEVPAGVHEMRGLIQLRNELASFMHQKRPEADKSQLANLPEPINLKSACGQCPHLLACSLHQKLRGEIPSAPHAMAELVPRTLAHLTESHADFFERWSVMCSMEGEESKRGSKLRFLWCESAKQREEKLSLCLSGLKLDPADGRRDPHIHLFTRSADSVLPRLFSTGETVLVSTDTELALSQGVVLAVGDHDITVMLDRDLRLGGNKGPLFHLDRYEFQGSSSGNLVSLVRLMSPSGAAGRLRRFVIDREPVHFLKGLNRGVVDVGKHILRPLNRVQQKAVFKVLMAEEYVLLKGMPGTGKTTLIVAIVRLLAALGKTVLLASYTHSAVDTILLKLKEHGDARFLRLGRKSRIHPDLQSHSAETLSADIPDLDALRELYAGFGVVATTCLGLNHPAVLQRSFDYCILDEAGQSTLLAALGPLFYANKFVLVGDPQQLPPVVQSRQARDLGMDLSLFSCLETTENTIPLTIQYRMNSSIMGLANRLVYNGQLECGSAEVAERTVVMSSAVAGGAAAWMDRVLSGKLEDSVLFLDTSGLGDARREVADASGVTNQAEVKLVRQIVGSFMTGESPSVGVIAPYRAQVALLKRTLQDWPSVDVNTVDQFQGKDKDVIVYSCTRSRVGDVEDKSGDILADLRRLNVAITRAKSKLVMVGDRSTLEGYGDTFGRLFACLKQQTDVLVLGCGDLKKL